MKCGGGGEHTAWSYTRVSESGPKKTICMNTKSEEKTQITDILNTHVWIGARTFTRIHISSPSFACGSEYKCIRWNITSCTFLSWYTPTDRCVCHLKVVWHGVSCIQTPASVWDYSSHSWIPGWAPKPILIPLQLWKCWSGNSGHGSPLDWFKNAINTDLIHDQHVP